MPHTCHAIGCETWIKPELLMCPRHWGMVPADLQRAVWKHYRRGQCDDMNITDEWLMAARRAMYHVAVIEGRMTERQAAEKYRLAGWPRLARLCEGWAAC